MGCTTLARKHGTTKTTCNNPTGRRAKTRKKTTTRKRYLEQGNIKYGLTALRNEPPKLGKWYGNTLHSNTNQNWEDITPTIQQGLKLCYPITNQTKYTPQPEPMDDKTNLKKWGTQEDQEKEENAHKQRSELQKRIQILDGELKKEQKILLAKVLTSWKNHEQTKPYTRTKIPKWRNKGGEPK